MSSGRVASRHARKESPNANPRAASVDKSSPARRKGTSAVQTVRWRRRAAKLVVYHRNVRVATPTNGTHPFQQRPRGHDALYQVSEVSVTSTAWSERRVAFSLTSHWSESPFDLRGWTNTSKWSGDIYSTYTQTEIWRLLVYAFVGEWFRYLSLLCSTDICGSRQNDQGYMFSSFKHWL